MMVSSIKAVFFVLLCILTVCYAGVIPKFGLKLKLAKFSAAVKPKVPLLLPPLLLLALSTSTSKESPLNEKRIDISGPFFQGWLVRVVDHDMSLSAITIVGSFSGRKEPKYSQHYVFCAVDSPFMKNHAEMFVDPCSVKISRTGGPRGALDIQWDAAGKGGFVFNDTNCSGQFTFANKFSIEFDTSNRIKWNSADRKFSFGGPEGWLGLLSPLMPCHYFVHSVGSQCAYRIRRYSPSVYQLTKGVSDALSTAHNEPIQVLSGDGFAHIEGNHGTSFPEGWIWSQGIAVNNTASYSLALGKFSIAGMTPTNCILYLRRANRETVVVRTTDLDSVQHTTNAIDGTVTLSARSTLKRYSLEMTIRSPSRADRAFNVTVHVPTVDGFSNSPGCKETYTALTNIKYTDHSTRNSVPEEYSFPLSALEYGGSFLEKLSKL